MKQSGKSEKSVVCFGDSNTWGKIPGTDDRHCFDVRWPGVLQRELGREVRVHEEGLNGRTSAWEDPTRPGRNGRHFLENVLETHAPIHLLVLMLGTNELKVRFGLTPFAIAEGVGSLLQLCSKSPFAPANVLLVSPPLLSETEHAWNSRAFEGGIERSRLLAEPFQFFAEMYRAEFLNAGALVRAAASDGIHLDAVSHERLGRAVAARARCILRLSQVMT